MASLKKKSSSGSSAPVGRNDGYDSEAPVRVDGSTLPLVDDGEQEERIITSKKRVAKKINLDDDEEAPDQGHQSNPKKSEEEHGYGTEPDITPARPSITSRIVPDSPANSPVLNGDDSPEKPKSADLGDLSDSEPPAKEKPKLALPTTYTKGGAKGKPTAGSSSSAPVVKALLPASAKKPTARSSQPEKEKETCESDDTSSSKPAKKTAASTEKEESSKPAHTSSSNSKARENSEQVEIHSSDNEPEKTAPLKPKAASDKHSSQEKHASQDKDKDKVKEKEKPSQPKKSASKPSARKAKETAADEEPEKPRGRATGKKSTAAEKKTKSKEAEPTESAARPRRAAPLESPHSSPVKAKGKSPKKAEAETKTRPAEKKKRDADEEKDGSELIEKPTKKTKKTAEEPAQVEPVKEKKLEKKSPRKPAAGKKAAAQHASEQVAETDTGKGKSKEKEQKEKKDEPEEEPPKKKEQPTKKQKAGDTRKVNVDTPKKPVPGKKTKDPEPAVVAEGDEQSDAKPTKGKKRTDDGDAKPADSPAGKKAKRRDIVVALSGIDEEERVASLLPVLNALKKRVRVVDEVTAETTHLIVGQKRTLKLLKAIALGSVWVVKPDWVFTAMKGDGVGDFDSEEKFGVDDWFKGAKAARRARDKQKPLFAGLTVHISSDLPSKMPRRDLEELLTLAGATLGPADHAQFVICAPGRAHTAKKTGPAFVPYEWVLDALEHYKLPDAANYVLHKEV